jgi:hypothetical protein
MEPKNNAGANVEERPFKPAFPSKQEALKPRDNAGANVEAALQSHVPMQPEWPQAQGQCWR